MSQKGFDYEQKTWGQTKVGLSPFCLGASRLKLALDDLKEVEGRVLEAGCGGGGMAKAVKFYRPELEVAGIDISQRAIGQAKRQSQGVSFKVGSVYNLPYKTDSLAAVLSFDLLEHLEEPSKFLKEARRVLKPGGVFSGFVPLEGSFFSIYFWLDKLGWQAKKRLVGHIQNYSLAQINRLFKEAGLKLDKKSYLHYFLFQLTDFGYHVFLCLWPRKIDCSVEDYLARTSGLKTRLIGLLKNSLALAFYLENRLFSFLPGGGLYFKAKNQNP